MKQKTKYYNKISMQYNTNDKYTSEQIKFYNKYPDVTRILMYSIFEDILEVIDKRTAVFHDPCGGFMREPALLQILGKNKNRTDFTGSDVSEKMIENALKIYPSLDGRLDVRTYDDYKKMISPDAFITRFGLGYSEDLATTLGGLNLRLKNGGYILGVTTHGILHEYMEKERGLFENYLIELSMFHDTVQFKKPKYNWKHFEGVINKYAIQKHLVFNGKEHPEKFSHDSPLDYSLFLLGKKSVNPISQDTVNIMKGTRILEKMMQINPYGNFSNYIMYDVPTYFRAKNNLIKLGKVKLI